MTKNQIVEIIKKNGQIQVKDLVQVLGITQAAIHRALNKLMAENLILKRGAPPRVFYFLNTEKPTPELIQISKEKKHLLEENYIYINPEGKIENGLLGFMEWMKNTKNFQKPENCVDDYIKIFNEAQSHRTAKSYKLIEATSRFDTIFKKNNLDKVFYHDFYSLIKFGKTKMGQLLLNGKQSQSKTIIKKISDLVAPDINKIIKNEKIQAVAWVPHSIPRKLPFLKELKRNLKLNLPEIEIIKIYSGDVPIAQKSLSKIEERIQNAEKTIVVVPTEIKARNILLIDDAVGSGATLNEVAAKLKFKGAKHIIGYAIVGSYKGFEVIREV